MESLRPNTRCRSEEERRSLFHFHSFMLMRPALLWTLVAAAAMPVLLPGQSIQLSAYTCRFVKIPVRDGVWLNSSICEPPGPHEGLPFLITRTPYSVQGDTIVRPDYQFLAADGYIVVYQDIRGRFGSEGKF